MPLRAWQRGRSNRSRLARTAPSWSLPRRGAGKTRPALELAASLLRHRRVARVVRRLPDRRRSRASGPRPRRARRAAAPDAASPRPPRDFHGVAVTYARVASAASGGRGSRAATTLVVVDEAHHLGEDLAWGERSPGVRRRAALAAAVGHAVSLRRHADPGRALRRDGVVVPDVSYTYAEAVARRHLPPGRVRDLRRDALLAQRRRRDRVLLRDRPYRPRGEPPLPHRDLDRAARRPAADPQRGRREARRRCGPAATATPAGLAVAADAEHARQIAKLLREVDRRAPVVVLHTEARGAQARRLPRSREPWIVAVNMVSEGVDIPRLRVGVYATAAKTPLIFRQIVGRFVRTMPGRPAEPSWLYLPPTRSCAVTPQRSRRELRHALRRRRTPASSRSRPSGARASRPSAEFVPLSADFAPQMTLFGAPQRGGSGARGRRRRRAPRGRRPGRRRRPRGVRAPRAAARGAQPPGRRPPPPRRPQPPRDQRVAQPRGRCRAASSTRASSSSSARSSCCSARSPAVAERGPRRYAAAAGDADAPGPGSGRRRGPSSLAPQRSHVRWASTSPPQPRWRGRRAARRARVAVAPLHQRDDHGHRSRPLSVRRYSKRSGRSW